MSTLTELDEYFKLIQKPRGLKNKYKLDTQLQEWKEKYKKEDSKETKPKDSIINKDFFKGLDLTPR